MILKNKYKIESEGVYTGQVEVWFNGQFLGVKTLGFSRLTKEESIKDAETWSRAYLISVLKFYRRAA